MSSPMPEPAAEPAEPGSGASSPLARVVAQDLGGIFPHEPPPRPPADGRLRLARAAEEARQPRRGGGPATLAAALCLGVSAGALLARPSPPAESSPAMAARPLPGPGPLVEPPASPLRVAAPAPAAVAPTPVKLRRVSLHRPASRVKPRRAGCADRQCQTHALVAADARLRHAYALAADAGVARPVLVDYRDEWEHLRERAPREPAVVAKRYREMADDLDRISADQRTAPAEPAQAGPWRRFRNQLAALWR